MLVGVSRDKIDRDREAFMNQRKSQEIVQDVDVVVFGNRKLTTDPEYQGLRSLQKWGGQNFRQSGGLALEASRFNR